MRTRGDGVEGGRLAFSQGLALHGYNTEVFSAHYIFIFIFIFISLFTSSAPPWRKVALDRGGRVINHLPRSFDKLVLS